jgi:hypothetical protein
MHAAATGQPGCGGPGALDEPGRPVLLIASAPSAAGQGRRARHRRRLT